MKYSTYLVILVFVILSCNDESSLKTASVYFSIRPHSSNNEFYTGLPVWIGGKARNGPPTPYFESLEKLYVNGSEVVVNRWSYTFQDDGIYQVRAFIKMSNKKTYELDTTITVVTAPPVFGNLSRHEKVLFAWKAETSYNVLMSVSGNTSAADYEVLSVNESLVQERPVKTLELDTYPDFADYGFNASGTAALLYDDRVEIYDPSLALTHRLSFLHGRGPRKVLMNDKNAVLLFDSLAHVTLKTLDLQSGALVKGPTHFVGVDNMTTYTHFFLDESRIASFAATENNDKTLLMGTHVGESVEFNHYFQPPVFIENVTPLSSGGYIINSNISDLTLEVLAADDAHVIKWKKSFTLSPVDPPAGISVKELGGFIYVFFDNMRCAKLSMDGQVIWDKYFYPENAQFQKVMITSNGDFIMVGNWTTPQTSDYNDLSQKDVVFVKIDDDGFRK